MTQPWDGTTRFERAQQTDEAAVEAERKLIVAVTINNALAVELDIEPEEISDETLRNLWMVARAAVTRGGGFSIGGVAKVQPETGRYLRELVDGYEWTLNPAINPNAVKETRVIIKEAAARRRLRDLAMGLAEDIDQPGYSPQELLAAFIRNSAGLGTRQVTMTKRTIAAKIVEDLKRPPVCYPTGMPGLDRSLGGGFYPGKMYGFGARKKSGKTLLGGTLSHNLNRALVPHGYISHEMKPEQIEQRSIARDGVFNAMEFLTRHKAGLADIVADYAISIPDHTYYAHRPGGTIDEDLRILAGWVTDHGIKGAFIDYLQIIRGRQKADSEEQHLGAMAQRFFDFCSSNDVFLVVFAQVNQQGNTRGGEGLKNACDAYYTFHRDKDDDRGWLENEEHRYAPYANVGSEQEPCIFVNGRGPFLEDLTAPPQAAPEHVPGYDLPLDGPPGPAPSGPTYSALDSKRGKP